MSSVDARGVRIAFEEHGPAAATPLLLVHSLGMDRSMWRGLIERLGDRFRAICPDLRGHGDSAAPPGPYAVDDLGLDLVAVADRAAPGQRPHLCGLSLGGFVSLWLSIAHGDRFRSVTVTASAPKIGTREGWQARVDAVSSGGMAVARDVALARFFSPAFAAGHPRVVADASATLMRTSPIGYAGCCAALRDGDLRDRLAQVGAPLLVVAGGADVACPPEASRRLADAVAGSRFVELDGAGHLVPLEREDAFARVLSGFLAEHGP